MLKQDSYRLSSKNLRARKTGEVTGKSKKLVSNVNVLLDVFNHYHYINRSQLLVDLYTGSGVIYLVAPRLLDIIGRVNLGNLLNVVPELEWLICSVLRTREFKFEPHPMDKELPKLDPDVVVNETVLELLGELIVVTVRCERGEIT